MLYFCSFVHLFVCLFVCLFVYVLSFRGWKLIKVGGGEVGGGGGGIVKLVDIFASFIPPPEQVLLRL